MNKIFDVFCWLSIVGAIWALQVMDREHNILWNLMEGIESFMWQIHLLLR